jgi:hypothetical protein
MVALGYYRESFLDPNKNTKMRGNDRAFALELIDDKAPISSTGLVDKRLFSGENKIHALRDEGSFNLWYFKYDKGDLPGALKDVKFTKFDQAEKFLTKYFNTRNIQIREVID